MSWMVVGIAFVAAYAGISAYSSYQSTQSAKRQNSMQLDDARREDQRIATENAAAGLADEEAQSAAKKRAYRSGVMFTSPTGLENQGQTSSAKLR